VNSPDRWLGQPELRVHELLRRLTEREVDFVVVGGVAVILQASPRLTKDLDICYAPEQVNLDRLGAVLIELGARLRGVEEDLPFVPDGSPSYPALRRRADQIDIDGIVVRVASIEDLIAMKRAAGRPQDLVDLESLEIARRRRRRKSS